MTATTRFYTGLIIALALIIGVSYFAGYHSGYHAGATLHARHAAPSAP